MSDWLERELRANLAPVGAPDALRDRVFRNPYVMPAHRISVFLIAAAMVVLSAGTVWLSAREPVRVVPERWNPTVRAQASDHNCTLCHTL